MCRYLHKERSIHSRAKQLYTIELLLQNLGSLLYVILFMLLYMGIEFYGRAWGRVKRVIILNGVDGGFVVGPWLCLVKEFNCSPFKPE